MHGKRILLMIVLLGGVGLATLVHWYGYERTWSLWNIPSMTPHFADLRTITGGAESHRLGLDPMLENPGDPWGRTMDYPRIWQGLFLLGIDQGDTALIGMIMLGLFAAGLFLFSPRIDRITALIMGLAVFSPAVLFGIERGNKDLLIFFLLAAALAVLRRSPTGFTILVTLGSLLVYFPMFGLVCLLRQPRRRCLLLGGISLSLTGLYMALTWHDMWLIEVGSLKGSAFSYGFNVIHTWVQDDLGSQLAGRILAGVLLLATAGVFLVSLRGRGHSLAAPLPEQQQDLDAFRLGAGIYAGTFLLGNNWDYRLIFLLFTIPQLVTWARQDGRRASWIARGTLVAVMVSLWMQFFARFGRLAPGGGNILFALDELANWVLLGGLLTLLARSAPAWLDHRSGAKEYSGTLAGLPGR